VPLDAVFRDQWGRVLATLVGILGDIELAEDAAADAFAIAAERWPRDGEPANPTRWLITTARHRAIDRVRRQQVLAEKTRLLARDLEAGPEEPEAPMDDSTGIEDERLELIFTCCHPSLAPDAQVALTLREVCGLTTEEIAQAFLSAAPPLAQRIVQQHQRQQAAHFRFRQQLDQQPAKTNRLAREIRAGERFPG
jgi:RNA polymerase sigma-70 factor (ECF subfamily)